MAHVRETLYTAHCTYTYTESYGDLFIWGLELQVPPNSQLGWILIAILKYTHTLRFVCNNCLSFCHSHNFHSFVVVAIVMCISFAFGRLSAHVNFNFCFSSSFVWSSWLLLLWLFMLLLLLLYVSLWNCGIVCGKRARVHWQWCWRRHIAWPSRLAKRHMRPYQPRERTPYRW